MATVTPFPLLERGSELAALDRAVESLLIDAEGEMLTLSGTAGIGKTRLLRELRQRCESQSLQILRADCMPLEQDYSFGVVMQLFERQLLAEKPGREVLLEGAAASAASIFADRPGPGSAASTFQLLHGLYWLTANLVAGSPTLIVIDDAHWADLASLRFLNFLSQRLEDIPALLVIASRPGEATGERDELLNRLSMRSHPSSLEPALLSASAVAELVRGELTRPAKAFCDACADATGGNPFLLGELIEGVRSGGVRPTAEAAAGVSRLAPASLGRAVLLRLSELHAAAIDLAKAVSVLGDDSQMRHAAALAALGAEEAAEAADALSEAGVLDLSDGMRFVHPMIASAVYSELGEAERGSLHRRAAELMAAEAGRTERIAAHLLVAVNTGDPAVVSTLREAAGEALQRGSPESAVDYLKRAVAEPADRMADVLAELGRAQMLSGQVQQAVHTLTQALEGADDAVSKATRHNALGHALYATGELPRAAEHFAAGADAAEREDPELALRNQADLISSGMLVPELHADIAARLPEAIKRARHGSLTSSGRAILASAALLAVLGGEPAKAAVAMADEAVDEGRLIAEEGSESPTIYSATGVLNTSGEFSRSMDILSQAMESARETGAVMGYATAIYSRAHPHLAQGRLAESIADSRAALDAQRYGWRQYLPVAYSLLIQALLERGELDQARTELETASEEDWDTDLTWSTMFWARGLVHLATGEPREALADFRTWGERWPVPNPAFYAEWRSSAAVAAAMLGDHDQAVELAAEELDLVARFDSQRSTGVALRALGLAQRDETGIETLQTAVDALTDSEATLELCRATVDLGALERRNGRRADARGTLAGGLDLAQRMGAGALARRASEEIKLAGGRPRSRSLNGADALSPGERRVAEMAAGGMTNRQIAQALFVTPKAVQWHLTNTYRKLEIGSREEIAAKLAPDSAQAD